MKSAIRQYMIGVSSYSNHLIASKLPGLCPFILVCEFPRSGGTWIRDMLGDALQLPVPRYSLLPVTFNALVHSHFNITVSRSPLIYVVRDGRDVFISHFHKAVNTVLNGTESMQRRTLKFHPSLKAYNDCSQEEAMIRFYNEWRVRPVGSHKNWGDHVCFYLQNNDNNVIRVRYEDMREKPVEALKVASDCFTAKPVLDKVIECAVYRNSFEVKTGRKPGEVSNADNKRSGKAGAWMTDLPGELKERFVSDFSQALSLAGYES